MNVDELALTKKLVYGTTTPGEDPNTHIRPNPASAQNDPSAPIHELSMLDYLTTGAGRYAKPSEAPLIQAFFENASAPIPLQDDDYNVAELRGALNLDADAGLLKFKVDNYTTDASSADFMERAYIFGGSSFFIKDNATFKVENGTYTIQSMEVIAQEDDFDYQSVSIPGTAAGIFLNDAFDPYGLIPEDADGDTTGVVIKYTGDGRKYTNDTPYTAQDFANDKQFVSDIDTPTRAVAEFTLALAGLATNTGYLGNINDDLFFRYYTADGKKVI